MTTYQPIQPNTMVLVETYSEPHNILSLCKVLSYNENNFKYEIEFENCHIESVGRWFIFSIGSDVQIINNTGYHLGKAIIEKIEIDGSITVQHYDDTFFSKHYKWYNVLPTEQGGV